jgi:hypothetical protein
MTVRCYRNLTVAEGTRLPTIAAEYLASPAKLGYT